MDVLQEKYGTVVKNDGVSLANALGVTDLWHAGNFMFGARLWGVEVDIATEPVGEEAEEIRVLSVRIEDAALQREGIYRRKIGITYRMVLGPETAESYIELPISHERYTELTLGLRPESKAWQSIYDTLKALTVLQGYEALGSWSVELTVKTAGGKDDDD